MSSVLKAMIARRDIQGMHAGHIKIIKQSPAADQNRQQASEINLQP
jgi:hypothetical protein